MRQVLILLCLLCISSLMAQNLKESEVPQAVLQKASSEFPDQKVRSWSMSDGLYMGQTKIEGATAYLVFDAAGKYVRTSYPLSPKELPSKLLDYVEKNFRNAKIGSSDLVEDGSGQDYYAIELRKEGVAQGKLAALKFDPNGTLMQRVDFETQEPLPVQAEAPEYNAIRKMKEGKTPKGAIDKIAASAVPAPVTAAFNKKYKGASEVSWYQMAEDFGADFVLKELRHEAVYTATGTWIQTKEEMYPDAIYAPVQKYLDTEYSRHEVAYAEKVTRADRNNSYYVEVLVRERGVKDPPVTQLFFDNTGRVTRAIQPQVSDTEGGYVQDESTNPRFDKQMERDIEGLQQGTPKQKKLREQELPTGITSYIYGRYPNSVKIREAVIEEETEWGSAYRISISKEGLMQSAYNLYFDMQGNLLQDNAPEDLLSKKARVNETEEIVEEVADQPVVRATDVPEIVSKNQAKRYPRSEELEWLEGEKDRYIARFIFRDLKHTLTFDAAGVILETRTETSLDRVYRPILTHIDANYPDYKLQYAEQIVRKDRTNFHYIELYTKKRKVSPQTLYLYYDKMGKPLEEEPELR